MSDLLNSASLIMIPSGYKEDTVYSVVPSDGSGDLSFTRASNGTRVNSAGLVEVCPWNLQTYSEDFSNASWAKNNSPVMAYNVATAPNGTMTADSIQSNTASVYQSVSAPTLSVAPNSTVTLSIYIKKETSKTYFGGTFLYFTGGTTKLTYVLFDEVNGTINIVAPDQVSMVTSVESVGDWWRFIITGTDTGSNTSLDFSFYGTLSQNGTSLSTGIGSVRTIWGAQLNIGSTAKPYFPTTDRLNVPRLTYQNGGGGCPSLLLEKQSTNLALYSEQFDDAAWTKARSTITANATTSPDGTTNADKFIENTANDSHAVLSAISNTSGQQYTVTIYAKAGERNWFLIYVGGGPAQGKFFNLSNGTLGSVLGNAPNDSSIIDAGNGWYRCSITYTATDASSDVTFQLATSDGTNVYTGNGTSGLFVWGIQVEQSSYPTSYIPTTSSSATRVADACFKNGITSLIGQSEGTLFAEFIFNSATFPTMVIFLTTNSSFANAVYIQTFSSDGLSFQVWSGVVNQVSINTTGLTNGQKVKVAVGYKANDFVIYINGVQKGTDTSGSLPASLNNLEIGTYLEGGSPYTYAQSINQAAVFKTRLTNAELASLTTI